MARNEEKAQSMLYRFREAQAAELGLVQKSDRRPRMASSCKDLRQCERWRGEILREISRKVSKIQDAGLTDYEIRDLNDMINKLLREKSHWENQIISLGGANYRRAGIVVLGDGREVQGQRGYKYFGRAKDLPGVKELLSSIESSSESSELESEHNKLIGNWFRNLPKGYFGESMSGDGDGDGEMGDKGEKERRELIDEEVERADDEWRKNLISFLPPSLKPSSTLPNPLPICPTGHLFTFTYSNPNPPNPNLNPNHPDPNPSSSFSGPKKEFSIEIQHLLNEMEFKDAIKVGGGGGGNEDKDKDKDEIPSWMMNDDELVKEIVNQQKKALLEEYGAG